MKNKAILVITACSLGAFGCYSTQQNTNTNTAVVQTINANVADVVNNPNSNVVPPPSNSAVPGIPNAPANMKVDKDPTRDAKVQPAPGIPAPDNSEIITTLADKPIQTRVFKNHPQLAKVEVTQDIAAKTKTTKVFLRNGQVKDLPEGRVSDPLTAPAAEILAAVGNVPPGAKPGAETKKAAEGQEQPASDAQPNPPLKQQKRNQ